MNDTIPSFIWFCASGYTFFIGIFFLLFAALISITRINRYLKILITSITLISIILIYLSATPLPNFLICLWLLSLVGWSFSINIRKFHNSKYYFAFPVTTICLSCIALIFELPYTTNKDLPKTNADILYIIGDSISAGIGTDSEKTWPKILQEKHNIKIMNLSIAGATVESAIKQTELLGNENAIVLLEIGGNDILGSTPILSFEKSLQNLLKNTTAQNRTIIMFELPILPWQADYIRIQRKLSKKYDFILIPRRYLVKVFATKDATLDSIHLSPKGHRLMAEIIWEIIDSSIQPMLELNRENTE